jgi:hypothetical protein
MNKVKLYIVLPFVMFFMATMVFAQKKTAMPEALQQAKLLRAFFSKEGLFGEIKPSSSPVEDTPDFSAYPLTIGELEINRSLALFAKAFYLRKDFDEATVEFDRFLLPNAENTKISVTWDSLKSISGKEIMDKSAIKPEDLNFTNSQKIPVKGFNEDDPVYEARGSSVIKIPSKYLRVDLSAADINKPATKGEYEITLRLLQNDVFEVYVKNVKNKDLNSVEVSVIPLGLTGRIKVTERTENVANPKIPDFIEKVINQLESGEKTVEELNAEMEKHRAELEGMSVSAERIYSGRALGKIKSVSVMIPEEEIQKKINIVATTEPDTNLENPQPLRAGRYVNNPKPVFEKFSVGDLKKAIKIYPDRSAAMFGYNTPMVVCKLPPTSNSEYSSVEFIEPVLLDKNKKQIPFELENGGYSSEKHSSEIRFQNKDGGDSLVSFDTASGKVHIKYPLKINTIMVKKNQAGNDFGVTFKGKFVTFNREKVAAAENSFSSLHSVRAYDASGLELYKLNYSYSASGDEGDFETLAFWGEPDRVEVDSVEEFAELDLDYNLAPASLLQPMK